MTREEQRRTNARLLAAQVGGLAEFARKTGMDNSQISQLIGKNPTKNIGNRVARRIEEAFGLPEGGLDQTAESSSSANMAPEEPEFHRHWLSKDEASFLAEYRSLTDDGRKSLRIMARRLERDDVRLGAVDEAK